MSIRQAGDQVSMKLPVGIDFTSNAKFSRHLKYTKRQQDTYKKFPVSTLPCSPTLEIA